MTNRLYKVPRTWPFPGPRAVAPAPRKPRKPKMTYTYNPERNEEAA
jgi:hypothetical protein